MAQVLITDTNLTNIANAIRTKNGTSTLMTPAQMSAAILTLPSYTKMAEEQVAVSTSSSTATSLTSITVGSEIYCSDIIYVKIRDINPITAGSFGGTDNWFMNYRIPNNSTSYIVPTTMVYRYGTDNLWNVVSGSYGVYGYRINSSGVVQIYTRYNSTYSLTINSTYKIEVYKLNWPTTDSAPWA